MLVYFLLISLSVIGIYFSDLIRSKSKIASIVIDFIVLMALSIIAGCRDVTIGTDTSFYAYGSYVWGYFSESFSQYMDLSQNEFLYLLTNYIAAKTNLGFSGALFLQQFFTLLLALIFVRQLSNGRYSWLLFACYLLVSYNLSLNIIRQSMAIVYIYILLPLLKNKQYKKYLLLSLLSFFIHKSAVVGAFVFFYIYYINDIEDISKQRKAVIFSVIASIGVFIIFNLLVNVISMIESVSRYSAYGEGNAFSARISKNDLLFSFALWMIYVVLWFCKMCDKKMVFPLVCLGYVDVLCECLGLYSKFAPRIGLYFVVYIAVGVPLSLKESRLNNNSKNLLCCLYTVALLFFWYYKIGVIRNHNTAPYSSEILGIN